MAREILNETVRKYAGWNNGEYRETWNHLYKLFMHLFHINLKVRARNRNMRPVEYAEKYGFITLLLGVALIVFIGY